MADGDGGEAEGEAEAEAEAEGGRHILPSLSPAFGSYFLELSCAIWGAAKLCLK